jgi:hypothetical protein
MCYFVKIKLPKQDNGLNETMNARWLGNLGTSVSPEEGVAV